MPVKDLYGTQPPIELIRQFFDFGHVYDRKEKNTISIVDTNFLCLAAPAEGGRNVLS
jgi:dynein heavy chain